LGNQWYVRNDKWKLNRDGELFDMSNSPFEENLVKDVENNAAAKGAKAKLQAVLDTLNPAAGIVDNAGGDGRHANKKKKDANGQKIKMDKGEKKEKKEKKNKEEKEEKED